MQQPKWDVKVWVIGALTVLVFSGGGFTLKTLAGEVQDVKAKTHALEQNKAVADRRFEEVQNALAELKSDLRDVRDLLIKTHMKELQKEKGGSR